MDTPKLLDIPKLTLNNGAAIPQIGFGLWKNTDEAECKQSIEWALQAGYRHFDTAQAYGNEQWLGDVLQAALAEGTTTAAGAALAGNGAQASGPSSALLQREDLFITTKIGVQHFGAKHTLSSFDESFKKLKLEYIDLVLLHFPVPLLRDKSWLALEEIQTTGRAKSIGVSNYTIKHLEHLLKTCHIKPAVNQVELHVFLQQPELLEYCTTNGILVEAYSPLAHGKGLDNPELARIGTKYGKTSTQVMLRWCVEQGTVPLPKSVHKERIAQNLAIFDFQFDDADRVVLQALNKDLRTCWDPTHIP